MSFHVFFFLSLSFFFFFSRGVGMQDEAGGGRGRDEQWQRVCMCHAADTRMMKSRRAVSTPRRKVRSWHSRPTCRCTGTQTIPQRVTCFDLGKEIRSRLPHQLSATHTHTHTHATMHIVHCNTSVAKTDIMALTTAWLATQSQHSHAKPSRYS